MSSSETLLRNRYGLDGRSDGLPGLVGGTGCRGLGRADVLGASLRVLAGTL